MELQTRFFDVQVRDDGIVWVKRKPLAYQSLEDIAQGYRDIVACVDPYMVALNMSSVARGGTQRRPFAWLYDVRQAPASRNDQDFELEHARHRPLLLQRSDLLCILCRTQTGVMQVTRMAKADGQPRFASTDLVHAIAELKASLRGAGE